MSFYVLADTLPNYVCIDERKLDVYRNKWILSEFK